MADVKRMAFRFTHPTINLKTLRYIVEAYNRGAIQGALGRFGTTDIRGPICGRACPEPQTYEVGFLSEDEFDKHFLWYTRFITEKTPVVLEKRTLVDPDPLKTL